MVTLTPKNRDPGTTIIRRLLPLILVVAGCWIIAVTSALLRGQAAPAVDLSDEWVLFESKTGNRWYIRESVVNIVHEPDADSAKILKTKTIIYAGSHKIYFPDHSFDEIIAEFDKHGADE